MKIAFWASLALIIYTYLLYPCLLLALASVYQIVRDVEFVFWRKDRRRRIPEQQPPTVSLVFSAFNEEVVIESKMLNCAELNYDPSRLEILVGCDGCTDRTVDLARRTGLPNVRVLDFHSRRGKPIVINQLVQEARGEIVVFSDANTILKPDAIPLLVRHFAKSDVGCVCGQLTLRSARDAGRTEGAYWQYEVLLKFLESRLNMLVGANGGIFAIRRSLFSPIPAYGIIDDFLVSMRIRQAGYRLVFDPEATASEETAATVSDEFQRRVRIGTGNFYALQYTWRLLSPTAGLIALAYWSHKVFRWLVAFALLVAFGSACALIREPFYAFATLAALSFCAMAVVGHYLERARVRSRLFELPYYFLSMNVALALGLVRCISSKPVLAWNRTPRAAPARASR